jgi:enamine deaminase RidA (YjgF/YER057c/UK114 family)
MTIERINPPDIFDTSRLGFPTVVASRRGRTIHTGSVAFDKQMQIVGAGDLRAQLRKTLENIRVALAAAAASPADVVHMRMFVVNLQTDDRFAILDAIKEFYGDGPAGTNTLIGIQGLARPELMVEIEVVAVTDDA